VRLVLLGLAIPVALVVSGGCPLGPPAETPDPERMTPEASAPATAGVGDEVALTARLADDVDVAGVIFRWFQTYGRAVELVNADTAEARFVAPSLPSEQTLRFRVDVIVSDETILSDTVEVAVAADPDYGLDESVGEDSGDDDPHPQVRLVTSMGSITVELDRERAPLTVNNFLRYVDDDFYDGTIFHRVIVDFVVQGGGYDEDLVQKETRPPIRNEADNGLTNDRGTIAMARTNAYDSATSQFYINVVDNDSLNYTTPGTGYAVFGRVIDGMDVVDRIAEVETETRDGMSDVPVTDVVVRHALRITVDGDDGGGGGDGSITDSTGN
jgi:peptidyl-prolyl cis-trans isomerase A (cyclophilin A)